MCTRTQTHTDVERALAFLNPGRVLNLPFNSINPGLLLDQRADLLEAAVIYKHAFN